MLNKILLFAFLCVILFLSLSPQSDKCVIGGHERIWHNKCVKKNTKLNEILTDYKEKRVGLELRSFLEWYKESMSASTIIKHLSNLDFKLTIERLQTEGYYITSTGETCTDINSAIPHFIFTHEDHSCIRIKPIIGGILCSTSPYPTISFSIVYNTEDSSFYNEAFKVNREGSPIPKAGLRFKYACLNPYLSEQRIADLMQSTHLKLPKVSIEDKRYLKTFKFSN